MTRIFSKPAMPWARARQTSAMPPVAIFSRSVYFPKLSGCWALATFKPPGDLRQSVPQAGRSGAGGGICCYTE